MKGIGFALEHLSPLLSASGGPPAGRLRRPSAINCGGGRRPNTFAFRPPVERRRGRKPQPVPPPPLHRISTSRLPSPLSPSLPFDSSVTAPALPRPPTAEIIPSHSLAPSPARCIAVTSRSRRRTAGCRGATCPKLELISLQRSQQKLSNEKVTSPAEALHQPPID